MSSRHARSLHRSVLAVSCPHVANVDALEGRIFMSVASSAGVACTCASCLASARGASAASANSAVTIRPLKPITTLSRAARDAASRAGAGLFQPAADLGAARNGRTDHVNLRSATPFTLDLPGIVSKLRAAPAEFTRGAQDIPVELAIPKPDGSFSRFKVVRSEVMHPALARQFPSIRTYRGVGIDDPTASLHLDTTDLGFHAQVLSAKGAYYIDPYFAGDAAGTHVGYYKSDALSSEPWHCVELHDHDAAHPADAAHDDGGAVALAEDFNTPSIVYGGTLKTFRTAVAANGEYTAYHGGTVAAGQAAIVTAMNRVSGVYESELGIRMTLVANNASLVYTDASTDPYSNTDGVLTLTQNQTNVDAVIGSANYDLGHVFTTGSGGIASLGVAGRNGLKARGTTGLHAPIGDPFTIDYVAHEIGHQFSGTHTFNTSIDNNRSSVTPYEPGSGVTIMAYAGLEGNDNTATSSIPYFHSASIDQVRNHITSVVPGAGLSTSTGNAAPTVSAGLNYVIPTNTPFQLTATGSDPDGDALTYDWQQRDLGAAKTLDAADNGSSPLFRNFAPSTSPTRMFPKLLSVLTGLTVSPNAYGDNAYPGERLPTVARAAMKFRVVARDNRAGGGGVATADAQVQVVDTGAPFAITSYGTAAVIPGGSTPTLNWNVAGTTANGINVANVAISLSTDRGNTFPIILAASTANDGSEPIQIPYGIGSSTARVKVEAIGNVFFDINDASLTITNVASPFSPVPGTPLLVAGSDTGISQTDGITRLNNASAAAALTFSVPGTVPGALVQILADNVGVGSAIATGTTTLVTTDSVTLLGDGARSFTARQGESGKLVSQASPTTSITIDTSAPTLTPLADRFGFEEQQTLRYAFNGASSASITADDFTVTAGNAGAVPAGLLAKDSLGNALLAFGSSLADGNYAVTLNADAITDVAGNAVASESTSFFVLRGDANRDRTVNFADLVILAQNYNQVGKTFSGGNFDYSADGLVNFADLVILAQRYNSSLAAPASAATLVANAKLSSKAKGKPIAREVLA